MYHHLSKRYRTRCGNDPRVYQPKKHTMLDFFGLQDSGTFDQFSTHVMIEESDPQDMCFAVYYLPVGRGFVEKTASHFRVKERIAK